MHVMTDIDIESRPGARTSAFAVANADGATIRGAVHRPIRGPGGGGDTIPVDAVILAVPGLGAPLRSTLKPALHLIANGFTVVRFDPTNAVGHSDGTIREFTPQGLVQDLHAVSCWAREQFPGCQLAYLGSSISGRAALRAAAQAGSGVAMVGTLGCVVDMRATLTALRGGRDAVVDLRHSRLPDQVTLLGHTISTDCAPAVVAEDWLSVESTVIDAQAGPYWHNVQGGADPWVSLEDARTVARRVGTAVLTEISGAGHTFSGADRVVALETLVRDYHRHLRVEAAVSSSSSSSSPPTPRAQPEQRIPTRLDLAMMQRIEDRLDTVLTSIRPTD
ncbi:hypothetical protein RIF23_02860 [Lipingzhangella sp. LS1_29]|uniref:Alpha/beta hydrolase family protein n=1 Tax=Lipingzhangella rawalii TaxID=2055835 RepID=A0ABU2H1R3_9ACTN|nr:hypothetical protein [Lipingzhangella rawalii]MDS1269233.1 hypothetical protein [Lipingzhangella rawalii]